MLVRETIGFFFLKRSLALNPPKEIRTANKINVTIAPNAVLNYSYPFHVREIF